MGLIMGYIRVFTGVMWDDVERVEGLVAWFNSSKGNRNHIVMAITTFMEITS